MKLLEPFDIGRGVQLKNRVVVPAHSYNLASDNGEPLAELFDYVQARIAGGASMIVLGETYVDDPIYSSLTSWGGSVVRASSIPIYEKIVARANQANCIVVDQLCHPGGQFWFAPGATAYAPSPVAHHSSGGLPRQMTESEIRSIVTMYREAAMVARSAGLHGIEIKADQGKLPHQFLSPLYNHRDDQFGLAQGGGFRFIEELIGAVRDAIGDEMLLGIRLPCVTDEPNDLSEDQCLENISHIVSSGLVDYLSLNGATNSSPLGYLTSHGDDGIPRITFLSSASRVRSEIPNAQSIPIILAGRIMTAVDAETVIDSNVADLVAMARTHIADPDFVAKLESGQGHRIRPCIGCNQSCVGNTWEGNPIRCIHNPETGLENEFAILRSANTGSGIRSEALPHFLVVGAGVAGLEAARTALELGARVTLTDSAISLGGSVLQWSKLESKRNFTQVVSYLVSEIGFLEDARLVRELGATVDESVVLGLQPDFVIDATGARPPDTSSSGNGVHISEIVNFEELLRFHHVTVQADSPLCGGLHLAKWLAERGCEVRVISSQEIGSGLDFATFTSVLRDLRGLSNVTLTNYSSPLTIGVGQLHMRDLLTGAISAIGCEMLVRCNGLVPNRDFASSMAKIGWPSYQIGDSAGFRGIEFAIRDARVKVLKLNAEWKQLAREKS